MPAADRAARAGDLCALRCVHDVFEAVEVAALAAKRRNRPLGVRLAYWAACPSVGTVALSRRAAVSASRSIRSSRGPVGAAASRGWGVRSWCGVGPAAHRAASAQVLAVGRSPAGPAGLCLRSGASSAAVAAAPGWVRLHGGTPARAQSRPSVRRNSGARPAREGKSVSICVSSCVWREACRRKMQVTRSHRCLSPRLRVWPHSCRPRRSAPRGGPGMTPAVNSVVRQAGARDTAHTTRPHTCHTADRASCILERREHDTLRRYMSCRRLWAAVAQAVGERSPEEPLPWAPFRRVRARAKVPCRTSGTIERLGALRGHAVAAAGVRRAVSRHYSRTCE